MDWIVIALSIIPLYLANATAMLFGGKTPLDLNKQFLDSRPIFGKGKTFKGTFIGIFIGCLSAFLIAISFESQKGKGSK